jgi:hypothetical protein
VECGRRARRACTDDENVEAIHRAIVVSDGCA